MAVIPACKRWRSRPTATSWPGARLTTSSAWPAMSPTTAGGGMKMAKAAKRSATAAAISNPLAADAVFADLDGQKLRNTLLLLRATAAVSNCRPTFARCVKRPVAPRCKFVESRAAAGRPGGLELETNPIGPLSSRQRKARRFDAQQGCGSVIYLAISRCHLVRISRKRRLTVGRQRPIFLAISSFV